MKGKVTGCTFYHELNLVCNYVSTGDVDSVLPSQRLFSIKECGKVNLYLKVKNNNKKFAREKETRLFPIHCLSVSKPEVEAESPCF